MKANVGMIDSIVRILGGFTLLSLTILGIIGLWGWIGLLPIITGVAGICPLYSLLHINTSSKKA